MNMQERVKNIGRAIKDQLLDRISDPELVAAWSGHLLDCTRTKFLQKTFQTRGPDPNWSNLGIGFEIVNITTTCTECGGSLTKRINE